MVIRTEADLQRETAVGDGVRRARLLMDMDQATLARRANVSIGSVRNLESGKGSTLLTLLRVLRAVGRDNIFEQLQPQGQPRNGRYGGRERQRASSRST